MRCQHLLAAVAWPAMLCACATVPGGALGQAQGPWRDQLYQVPEKLADGTTHVLTMRVCRPPGDAPAPVVILNHGTPLLDSDRVALRPQACESPAAQWFLHRGDLVALPLRRGHGDGGPLAESSGSCADPNYVQAGLAGAADIAAAIATATALPFARPDHAIVIGQSTGGWATIAYGSLPHPRVSALIAMAPGRGGRAQGVAGQTCRADLLAYSAAYFATTDPTPMLWLFTANDSNFAPAAASAMARSYQAAGGALQYEALPAFEQDGHGLFLSPAGPPVWGPIVAHYLAGL